MSKALQQLIEQHPELIAEHRRLVVKVMLDLEAKAKREAEAAK